MGLPQLLLKSFFIALVPLQFSQRTCVLGYRFGDVVDTVLVVDGNQRSNPLRHQMPIFGANWIPYVRFEKSEIFGSANKIGNDDVRTISLLFEDGFWVVPAISLTKNHGSHTPTFLDHLTIQFVYSKDGSIHAVLMKESTYLTDSKSFFHITYEWIEEDAVSSSLGLAVMFFLVLLFSIFSFLENCGIIGSSAPDPDFTVNSVESSSYGYSPSQSVPKFD